MAQPVAQSELVLLMIAVLFCMSVLAVFVFVFLRWHYSKERRDRMRASIAAAKMEEQQ